jgi:hypothetical protein
MIFALMFATMSFVIAENESTVEDTNQGDLLISPVPTLYSENVSDNSSTIEAELEMNESASTGDVIGQQFRNWFIFNQEKKIEAELRLAKLRLIQAKIAAKNNNTEAMERAMDAHDRIMGRIQERMDRLDDHSDLNGLNDSAIELDGLQRAIQVHELRVEYLQNVLNNSNLSEQQREKIELRLEKAQNNTAHLIQVSDDREEEIKTKLMAVGNLTEDQVEQILEITRPPRLEDRVEQRQNNLEQMLQDREDIRQRIREEQKQRAENSLEDQNDDSNDTEDSSIDNNETEED